MTSSEAAQARYGLAASQVGAADAGTALQRQLADLIRQAENGIQFTSYTWVQSTRGVGFRLMKVTFDVAFAREPVFTYGAAMVSVSTRDYLPIGHGLVQQWLRGGKDNSEYVGANVALLVELRYTPGYSLTGFQSAPGGSAQPVPTLAHHLTFTGPAGPLSGAVTNDATPRQTGLSK